MQKIPLDANSDISFNFELYLSKIESSLGLVQISHGMAEHKQRYSEFINFLNTNGIDGVYTNQLMDFMMNIMTTILMKIRVLTKKG